ncbi:MAG: hypothetical protein ACYTFA_17095, partial [Planctomycetota bacterium]
MYSVRHAWTVAVLGALLAAGAGPALAQCEWDKLSPDGGAAGDRFGASVSVSGEYAIIGAREADSQAGAAYIFKHDGVDWVQQTPTLTASDRLPGDEFGGSVSISGDCAIVGAEYDDDPVIELTTGAAYIFCRNGDTWVEQKLTAWDMAEFDHFGASVAIDGDYAVVGATYDDDNSVNNSGSAYVFKWTGTTWAPDEKLHANDPHSNDRFGRAVAISGDYIVVGTEDDRISDYYGAGSAYVFFRSPTSGWGQQGTKRTASDPSSYAYFGHTVSIDGDVVVVGAYSDNNACIDVGDVDCGAAYVFRRDGTSWPFEQKLAASDTDWGQKFGTAVAVSGDRIVVGAPSDNHAGSSTGAAYLFVKDGPGAWAEMCRFTAFDASSGDRYGMSVAMDRTYVLIAAPWDNVRSPTVTSGSAYIIPDCNGNCVHDECDTDPLDPDGDEEVSADCNNNGVPDECDDDCQPNGIADECEIDMDSTAPGGPFSCDPASPPVGLDECDPDCNNNGIPDECDIASGTSLDTNSNGIPDECDCPDGVVEFLDEVEGVIDARQPHPLLDANDPQGISAIAVSAPEGAHKLPCWSWCETAGTGPPLEITGFDVVGGGELTVILNREITPGAITTLTYTPQNGAESTGVFTAHPGNVDGDDRSDAADIAVMIDCCLNHACDPVPMYRCDIDRSGGVTATDTLRVID